MDVEPMTVEFALDWAEKGNLAALPDFTIKAARTLAAEVRRLGGAVPAGCVRDENGVDVPFVGTLPRTADGVIVGHGATIYVRDGYKADAVGDGMAWGPVTFDTDTGERFRTAYAFDQCYSTRAAAEAARERGGT